MNFLIRDKFDSMSHIGNLKAPLMIFQGRKDPVIPPHHAEFLFSKAAEPKELYYFEHVGHTEFDPDILAQHVVLALQ